MASLFAIDVRTWQVGWPNNFTPAVQVAAQDRSSLPAGCELEKAVPSVESFLNALNQGDEDRMALAFPDNVAYPQTDKRGFQWYSVTDEGGHVMTHDLDELMNYFAVRHQQHVQLQRLELEVNASWHPGVDLVFRLSRKADDLSQHEMVGKGAMYCDDQTIFVWSMAQDMPDPSRRDRRATPEEST